MAWVYRIILLLTLGQLHRSLPQHTLSILFSPLKGIAPVTTATIPLTADDLARGLVSHPVQNINSKMLSMSHSMRYQLGTVKNQHIRLHHQQQEDALLLMRHLEKP